LVFQWCCIVHEFKTFNWHEILMHTGFQSHRWFKDRELAFHPPLPVVVNLKPISQ
jgi:hypothetical protein